MPNELVTRATPDDVAVRYWAHGHGVTSLAVTGVMTRSELRKHAPAGTIAIFVAAGDDPRRAKSSVGAAWQAAAI